VSEYSRPPVRNRRLETGVYRQPDRPVFVTIRAAGALVPFREPGITKAVIDALLVNRDRSGCAVYAYCLMPDHVHFVAAPGEGGDVCSLVDRFKSASTRVAWRYGVTGRLWQPRWYDHVVRRDESLVAICEYVLLNPVRARLVARSRDYPWCGQPDPIP